MAVRLLETFLRDTGTFDLSTIKVFAGRTAEEGEFSLRFNFIADHDADKYNYAYFEVYLNCDEHPLLPFWPFKFTVGFQ